MSENNRKWPGPEGMIPVLPANASNATRHTRDYLDRILIEERILDACEADLTTEILGRTYSSPIMMPAFSHLNKAGVDHKPMEEYAAAAKELNVLNWVGMESDEDYEEIARVGAPTVRIIKPFADQQVILDQMAFAKAHGAVAVGVDIDHVFGTDGKYDVVDGFQMGPVTGKDLERLADATDLPFVAKGVLSVRDAAKCAEAGVKAIVVSHHHGRLPFAVPPVLVLPEIRKELDGTGIEIYCDCSIDDGRDAYKALALGADAVSVGRGILPGLLKEGTEGVVRKVRKMNEELAELMGYTGVDDTRHFDPSVLHIPTLYR